MSCKKKTDTDVDIYPFLRLGFQANKTSKEYYTAKRFAEKVYEFSNGTVEIKIFPNGQLGDDKTMLEKVINGTLDITYAETGRLGLWVPEAQIFGFPFAFDDFNHLKRTVNSDYGKSLHEKFLAKGLRVLSTGYNGTRQTTSNKPIYSIEDMHGMNFRVPAATANIKFAEYSGANPVVLPFHEVYTYLKADIIDGQENPLSTIDAQKFYKVQKYCAFTSHIINDNNIIISEKSYNILSPEQKDAVKKAAEEASLYQTELFRTDEEKLIEDLKKQGMSFTNPDKLPFRTACKPMYDDFIEKYGKEPVEAILNAR